MIIRFISGQSGSSAERTLNRMESIVAHETCDTQDKTIHILETQRVFKKLFLVPMSAHRRGTGPFEAGDGVAGPIEGEEAPREILPNLFTMSGYFIHAKICFWVGLNKFPDLLDVSGNECGLNMVHISTTPSLTVVDTQTCLTEDRVVIETHGVYPIHCNFIRQNHTHITLKMMYHNHRTI